MPLLNLEYLLDRHFVWTLKKEEIWDPLLDLGPGICLLFVLPTLGGAPILIDAVLAEREVSAVARAWIAQHHLESALGDMQVRFAAFPNLRERVEVMSVIRMHLPLQRAE